MTHPGPEWPEAGYDILKFSKFSLQLWLGFNNYWIDYQYEHSVFNKSSELELVGLEVKLNQTLFKNGPDGFQQVDHP